MNVEYHPDQILPYEINKYFENYFSSHNTDFQIDKLSGNQKSPFVLQKLQISMLLNSGA